MVSTRSIHRRASVAKRRAFTLAEVMIATVIFVVSMMAILSTIIAAYKVTMVSRYQDRAFNALRTIADQFQNAPTNDKETSTTKVFFKETTVPTGTGMAWDTVHQTFVFPSTTSTATSINTGDDDHFLTVPLGTVSDTTPNLEATVKREVEYLTPSSSVGAFIRGTFTIEYSYLRSSPTKIKVVVLRNLNPSDTK